MGSKERAIMALNAMKNIGISDKRVKPVLKNLLRLYNKQWEPIEEENYRVLIEAIFEQEKEENEEAIEKRKEVALPDELPVPSSKKMCLRNGVDQASSSAELVKQEVEDDNRPIPHLDTIVEHGPISSLLHSTKKQAPPNSPLTLPTTNDTEPSHQYVEDSVEHNPISPQPRSNDNGKGPNLSSQIYSANEIVSCKKQLGPYEKECTPTHINNEKVAPHPKSTPGIVFKEPKIEPGIIVLPKEKLIDAGQNSCLSKPKDPLHKDFYPAVGESNGQVNDLELSTSIDKIDVVSGGERPASFEIASSALGDVKISLDCNRPSLPPNFHVPSLDVVLKAVEDKYLRSYQNLEPSVSVLKLMQDTCQSFLDLYNKRTDPNDDSSIQLIPDAEILTKSNEGHAFDAEESQHGDPQMPTYLGDGPLNTQGAQLVLSAKVFEDDPNMHLNQHDDGDATTNRDEEETNFSNSQALVVAPYQEFAIDVMRPIHDVNDISKGQEKVKISVVNEVNSVPYPPLFHYIRWNTIYQSAYLNFSLARIGDDDCCSSCFGNCLSLSIPCACARDTGGEFAYTLEGLVKEKFLDECISMKIDTPKDRQFYCKVCPIEGMSEPCKGHLVRKFIKECWSKCGCSNHCGNRVVQRGITCSLQVFLTSEGKGWGVRTLEDLPKGTFICEYVGEVLTNTELDERNMKSTGNERHTYPVLLDADWGSEGVLKDEEALCLDATYYGNVARFINHRCTDSNLVDIPVEVETPDHHYYHLAFFTSRKVEALEELTWDYQIDFDDKNHPVKAFRCCCKSKYCRDMKRPQRNKSKSSR